MLGTNQMSPHLVPAEIWKRVPAIRTQEHKETCWKRNHFPAYLEEKRWSNLLIMTQEIFTGLWHLRTMGCYHSHVCLCVGLLLLFFNLSSWPSRMSGMWRVQICVQIWLANTQICKRFMKPSYAVQTGRWWISFSTCKHVPYLRIIYIRHGPPLPSYASHLHEMR